MFLDTSGASGGPWQNEQPQKPSKDVYVDLVRFLGFLAIGIVFEVISISADLAGLENVRDGSFIWMMCALYGALCVLGWMVLKWQMSEMPHPHK